jgi:hypothetical protein
MFATADWTQPQMGGLLSEIIEKEERQLREPKPRVEVQHVWDARTLRSRPSVWPDVRCRPQEDIAAVRSKLGMSVPPLEPTERPSRSRLLAARRTRDSLAAMDRERAADAVSGEVGFKSAASLFTPKDLQSLRPTYAPNERLATETTAALIGLGARRVPLNKSRYNRMAAFPPDFTDSRNNPDRTLVSQGLFETRERAKPWLTDPAPPVPPKPASHIIPRSQHSSFCVRPGEYPVVG